MTYDFQRVQVHQTPVAHRRREAAPDAAQGVAGRGPHG